MDNRHLIAPDGMVLTNGEVYLVEVWLGSGDNPDNWREVVKPDDMPIEDEGLEV